MNVHGVENLRVVDASLMPNKVSDSPNARTQTIAERAADFIRGREQLPEFYAQISSAQSGANYQWSPHTTNLHNKSARPLAIRHTPAWSS